MNRKREQSGAKKKRNRSSAQAESVSLYNIARDETQIVWLSPIARRNRQPAMSTNMQPHRRWWDDD
jgi:hypothetical protein